MKKGAIFLGILIPGLIGSTIINLLTAYFGLSNHWIGPVIFGLFLAFGTHPFISSFETTGEGTEEPSNFPISPAH